MDRQQILQIARQDPRFEQAADIIEQKLMQMGISPEMIDQLIQVLEQVLDSPESYPQVRAMAIQQGIVREADIPAQYDPVFVVSILLALYELDDRIGTGDEQATPQMGVPQQLACGGLAKMGRGGDTMLAHINSREAEVLRRMGGAGTVNPNTGIREFKGGGLGDIISVVAPIALDFIAPGIGSAIGGALGGGVLGSIGSSAIVGGLGAALGGGDVGKGILGGALGGGLGGVLGGGVSDALNLGLSKSTANTFGNSLLGGAASALGGGNFLQGATRGALGTLAGNAISGLAGEGSGAFAEGIRQGGSTFGNALSAGYTPQQALVGGALAGLSRGLQNRSQISEPEQVYDSRPANATKVGENIAAAQSPTVIGATGGLDMGKALALTPTILTLLSGAETPEQVQQAAPQMSPEQREYFSRASQTWDWDKMKTDAAAQGMNLGRYMATNWNSITGGKYVKMSHGGPLSNVAYLARGAGTGRSDEIDARLSDGEFVIDAETVALLGDGSTKAGAEKLEQMRQGIRQHKGKTLAKGNFSPNAKSPLAYMKEAA